MKKNHLIFKLTAPLLLLVSVIFSHHLYIWGDIKSFFIALSLSLFACFFILDFSLQYLGISILAGSPSGIVIGYLTGKLIVSFSQYQDGPGMAPDFTPELLPVLFAVYGLIYGLPLSSLLVYFIRLKRKRNNKNSSR